LHSFFGKGQPYTYTHPMPSAVGRRFIEVYKERTMEGKQNVQFAFGMIMSVAAICPGGLPHPHGSKCEPYGNLRKARRSQLDNAACDGKLRNTAAGQFTAIYKFSIKEEVHEKIIHRHHSNLF
jgi:hypothetical protein